MSIRLGSKLRELDGPVMITGHTGFKGTWLTLLLKSLGIEVIGYSLEAKKDSLFERLNLAGTLPEEVADIRDIEQLRSFVNIHKPSCVFHLAAQPLVMESYKSPLETFEVNAMGTAKLLEVVRHTNSIMHVGVVTTDKVYRNEEQEQKFVEADPLAGRDPYSASKVAAEAVASAWQNLYSQSDGPLLSIYRAGNVVGGGDFSEDRLLPDLVRALNSNESPRIRNLRSTRPWQHVLDPLVGYIMATEYSLEMSTAEIFNFGPSGHSLPVADVVTLAKSAWQGKSMCDVVEEKNQNYEAPQLALNSEKAHSLLGWKPLWGQELSVIATINWWNKVLLTRVGAKQACVDDLNYVNSWSQ